jgi:amino acid transporter
VPDMLTATGSGEACATSARGLRSDALNLLASVVFGVASVAPAYSLAATVGLVAAAVGLATPFVMILAFIPMVLVASGFYYMNRANPDCGETFIWTARAFGPHVGWLMGWAALASSVIVLANLAQIASLYLFLFLGLHGLAASTLWVTVGGVCWIVFVTFFVAVGIQISAKVQYVLLTLQVVPLMVFTVWAIVKAAVVHPAGYAPFRISWFFTTRLTGSQLATGVTLAVFIYWGWDAVTCVNEESEDSRHLPGVSALLNTLILVLLYVLASAAMQTYHGASFLARNPGDVFSPIAHDVMGGGWDKLVLLSVFTSGAASALTTLLPTTRQTLSMAAHKGLPRIFGEVHPKYLTPLKGTLILAGLAIAWYVLLTWANVNLLYDAIGAIGIMICLAYGSTGLAATVYYRKELLKSRRNFLLIGVAPTVGALLFAAVLVKVLKDDWSPGSSSVTILGRGGIFVMGAGVMALGAVLLVVMWLRKPEFFRRRPETWPGEGRPLPYADERVEAAPGGPGRG